MCVHLLYNPSLLISTEFMPCDRDRNRHIEQFLCSVLLCCAAFVNMRNLAVAQQKLIPLLLLFRLLGSVYLAID
jgi:hypothetical protein